MIRLAILLLISFSTKALHAQSSDAEINHSLETVIQHFPSGLSGIKGQPIITRGLTAEYHSTINISGASPAIISEQQFPGRKLVSWKSILFSGINPEEVKIKYREVFNLLNNSIIKSGSEKPFILSGKFREPFITKTASSHFSLLPATGELKDVRVDLVIEKVAKGYVLAVVVR
jgi:hypothetical protein